MYYKILITNKTCLNDLYINLRPYYHRNGPDLILTIHGLIGAHTITPLL
jgi:hypothetical protein